MAPAAALAETQAFRDYCGQLAEQADADGTITVQGNDGWMFFSRELRHLSVGKFWGDDAAKVSRARKPEDADPLPAILDFRDQLKGIGVQLILVPVPPKAVVYPQHLAEADIQEDVDRYLREFYGVLRGAGVNVVDLSSLFAGNRDHERGPVYCKQDSHWSGVGCVLAAARISDEVSLSPETAKRADISTEWTRIEIAGDLWRSLNDETIPKEQLAVRRVTHAPQDEESPVVLLGDSHDLVFHDGGDMFCRNAGLADQLAVELGVPVDLVAVRGSGATPARINLFRKAKRDPGYWNNKKYVIWCFSAREFTESDGWKKVPIRP